MSGLIKEHDVGIWEETGRVRLSVILEGGDAKYFSIPKKHAWKLASDLTTAAHGQTDDEDDDGECSTYNCPDDAEYTGRPSDAYHEAVARELCEDCAMELAAIGDWDVHQKESGEP